MPSVESNSVFQLHVHLGTTPTPSLLSAPGIQFHYLATPPSLPRQLFVVTAPIKVLIQVLSLLRALLGGLYRPPEFILVQVRPPPSLMWRWTHRIRAQNPPSIPTLAVVQFAAWLRGSKVIIDWHNLGYSILALKLGQRHPVVRIAAKYVRLTPENEYLVKNASHVGLRNSLDGRRSRISSSRRQ